MKMGTIVSPWRYDAAARDALQTVNLLCPAILHYASWAAFPDFRLPFDNSPLDQPAGLTRWAHKLPSKAMRAYARVVKVDS